MRSGATKATVDIRREIKHCPTCGQRFSRDAAFCPFDGVKLEGALFDPSGDPLLGALVDGRYEVISVLGEGGMGRVYEVRHAALDRTFAMKVLRPELARELDLGERFIREAKATASVKHPNVVQITDFGRFPDGIPYFVMELLEGQTLGEIIKAGGPLPAGRAIRVIRKVAGALGAAHEAGVVHRDLKPDNVFVVDGHDSGGTSGTDVRVVDFGAAKIVGSSRMTRAGVVFGTPHYMSPEQASGQSVDHRTDIYALGVIMYEMFTGRVPFEADTYMGVLTQHMFVQPERPSVVSESARDLGELENITLACLSKKPEERYASMADLVRAIDGAAHGYAEAGPTGAPLAAPRESQPPSGVRGAVAGLNELPALEEVRLSVGALNRPRSGRWIWLAIGVTALLVIVLAGRLFGRREAPAAPAAVLVPEPVTPVAVASVSAIGPPAVRPAPSAASPASPPAAPSEPAPPARPTVRHRLSQDPGIPGKDPGIPGKIDDVGDPFAGKR